MAGFAEGILFQDNFESAELNLPANNVYMLDATATVEPSPATSTFALSVNGASDVVNTGVRNVPTLSPPYQFRIGNIANTYPDADIAEISKSTWLLESTRWSYSLLNIRTSMKARMKASK